MKTVFMGTPAFAVPALERLIASEHSVELVVTQPDRKGNRGKIIYSPVKELAIKEGLNIAQPGRIRKDEGFLKAIKEMAPDLIVVAAFGQILPQELLDMPKFGCLNIHGSLLPELRGAAPMQYSILDGRMNTGVTIMRMDAGLDTGDIVSQEIIPVNGMDINEMSEKMSVVGADLLIRTIKQIERGEVVYTAQDESKATYSKLIEKSDGLTYFEEPADVLERKLRAYKAWPTLHSTLNGSNVKFYDAEVSSADYSTGKTGEICEINDNNFIVKCSNGALVIKELQIEGKKRMRAGEFLRGYKLKVGDRFESIDID